VEQSKAHDKTTVAMTYVQIYCERIFDLLDPSIAPSGIVVREDPERGVYLDGASVVSVTSAGDCLELLRRGSSNRAVASTAMNDHSSRSHAVLILRVERKEFVAVKGGSSDVSDPPRQLVKLSNLFLVDLAGSERVKKSRVTGRHVSELKAINLSLSALGNCISALGNQQKHVPYRDSKLTRLLQSSLGGNAKTALVVTVTTSPTDAQETLSTLQFGQRAMQVAVRAQRNVLSVLDYRALYEDARQKLDEEEQRVRLAEGELTEARERADELQDQLLKASIRIQHLEFENQAAKAVGSSGGSGGSDGDGKSGQEGTTTTTTTTTMVEELVARHERDLAQIKRKCDQQVATYQKLAETAAQEWHEVENELTGEKTSSLGYLQELKEFKLRFFQLEQDTAERIDELLQEQKERERERDAAVRALKGLEKETLALKQKVRQPVIPIRWVVRVN
jgi:kinesin family protein 5